MVGHVLSVVLGLETMFSFQWGHWFLGAYEEKIHKWGPPLKSNGWKPLFQKEKKKNFFWAT